MPRLTTPTKGLAFNLRDGAVLAIFHTHEDFNVYAYKAQNREERREWQCGQPYVKKRESVDALLARKDSTHAVEMVSLEELYGYYQECEDVQWKRWRG